MNSHRASLLFAGLATMAASAGCKGTTSSDLVETGDMAAFITVTDDGTGSIDVAVDLQVRTDNDSNYVRLAPGDSLSAAVGKKSTTLESSGSGQYSTYFPLSNAADVRLSLQRTEYEDALKTSGVLPEAIAVDGFYGAVISRSLDTIVIELPETRARKTVDIQGSCINSFTYEASEWAEDVIIDSYDLYASDGYAECDVTLTVTTTSHGTLDGAFHEDSTFLLQRSRSTRFYSTP